MDSCRRTAQSQPVNNNSCLTYHGRAGGEDHNSYRPTIPSLYFHPHCHCFCLPPPPLPPPPPPCGCFVLPPFFYPFDPRFHRFSFQKFNNLPLPFSPSKSDKLEGGKNSHDSENQKFDISKCRGDDPDIRIQHAMEELDDEEEEEPIFVMTEEWTEFFAKSEAKRISEKRRKGKE